MSLSKKELALRALLVCWIVGYAGLWGAMQWEARKGLYSSEDLFNYHNKTALEALKLLKNPDQPLPKGWFKVQGRLMKNDVSSQNLCEVLKTRPPELLRCDEQNRIYFE